MVLRRVDAARGTRKPVGAGNVLHGRLYGCSPVMSYTGGYVGARL